MSTTAERQTAAEIKWVNVNDSLPDEEITVLIYLPDDDEPIWLGYLEEEWYLIEGRQCSPTHWAEIPAPPNDQGG